MKAAALATVVNSYAEALRRVGAAEARDVSGLAKVLEVFGSATVAVAVKRLAASIQRQDRSPPLLSRLAEVVGPLESILLAASKTAAKDVASIRALLSANSDASLADLALAASHPAKVAKAAPSRARGSAPVRAEVISRYVAALDSKVGDEQAFAALHKELAGGQVVSGPELTAVAKAFSGYSTKTKPDALKRIWAVHQEVLVTRAKRLATAGHTAA